MSLHKFLKNEFLFNGHLQSLSAAGLVSISSSLVLFRSTTFALFVATYFLFELIFIFDRYHDIEWDTLTNNERSRHLLLYKNKIPFIGIFLVIGFVSIYFYYSGVIMLTVSVFVAFFGILYPLFFKKLTKKIPLFKNIYVSAVYSFLTLFPSIYFHQTIMFSYVSIYLICVVFIESMISQVTLDTKDLESDGQSKLKTLPVLIGNEKTIIIATVSSFLLTIINILFCFLQLIPSFFMIILPTLFLVNLTSINKIKLQKKSGYYLSASKFLLLYIIFVLFRIFI